MSSNQEHTATRVLAAARQHFLLHGFRGVTMEDLAAELHMSKKTLYACYSSKAALIEAVVREKFNAIEADLRRLTEGADTPFSNRLHDLVACIRGHTAELHPVFLRDLCAEAPELFARIQQQRRELIHRYFGQVLEEGRQTRVVRQDIPSHLLIEILIGAVESIATPSRLEELGLTPRNAFTQIISVFLEGALVRSKDKAL